MKQYTISIFGQGGEFSLGSVTSEKEWLNLINLNKNNELSAWNILNKEDELDGALNFYDFTSVVNITGANINDVKFIIKEVKEDLDNNEQLNQIKTIKLEKDYKIQTYCKSIPEIVEPEISTKGYFGGASLEKGNFESYFLELDQEINVNYLRTLTINLSEVLCDQEIISDLLYISDTEIEKLLSEYGCEVNHNLEEAFKVFVFELYLKDPKLTPLSKYIVDHIGDNSTVANNSFSKLYSKNGTILKG